MENNNTPRKARMYYAGHIIPVLIVQETRSEYQLVLDSKELEFTSFTPEIASMKRNIYMDACLGYAGAGEKYPHYPASEEPYWVSKDEEHVLINPDEPEHEEEGEPTEMTEPDNAVPFPKVAKFTELDSQLNLMAHLNYEVKSWDISFPEDGEPQLYATFTKVEAEHPF